MFDRHDPLSHGYLFKVNIKSTNLYSMKYLDQILNSFNPSLFIMVVYLANVFFLPFVKGLVSK